MYEIHQLKKKNSSTVVRPGREVCPVFLPLGRERYMIETSQSAPAALTEWPWAGDLGSKRLFLTVLEAGEPKIKVSPRRFLVRAVFPPCRNLPSPCVLTWPCVGTEVPEQGGETAVSISSSSPILLGQDLILMTPFNLNCLLNALTVNTVTLGVRTST